MIAGPPQTPVDVPPGLVPLLGGGAARPVWKNQLGGLTFEVTQDRDRLFVKWAPAGSGADLAAERDRLGWAGRFHRVPPVVELGGDGDGDWLVTRALPGQNAVSDRWKARPETAVRAIGEGLRALHEALPAGDCPFSWSAEQRLALAERRVGAGLLDEGDWRRRWRMTPEQALDAVADPPPVDRLVVCHGDSCAPNTLLTDAGRWSGHVDLGTLGVADRWADLAVATWSTEWNYGPGWEEALLRAYGTDPDPERTRYYRILWDLGP